tara:strand:+ start:4130 stop:4300 length:171 start_codon:yes stop_codon:yes gene_type:complete
MKMKLNKSVETMTRGKRSHDPDFRISSDRVLRFRGKEFTFHLDLWFQVKKLSGVDK